MHAVEATHHVAVHHVDHRLGHRGVDALVGRDAFLDDDFADGLLRIAPGHVGLGRIRELIEFFDVPNHQGAAAVDGVVGLDHHKGFVGDAVFLVLAADLAEQSVDVGAQAVHARVLLEVDLATLVEHRVDEPRVHVEQLAKALGHFFVGLEMVALAPRRPSRVQWRQEVLLVQVFQNTGHPSAQIVVEQNRARVEVLEHQAVLGAHQRLQGDGLTAGQVDGGGLLDVVGQRAQAHVQTGLVEDALELRQVAEVEAILGVFGHEQQVARFGADFFDRGHGRLHGQGHHLGREVVPCRGEQVGVHRGELEARVADVDGGIKRRRVLHPFQTEPTLDDRRGFEDALLKLVDGAVECGDQVGNHEYGMDLTHLLASLGLVAGEILGSLLGGLPSGNNAAPGTTLLPETPNRVS